MVSSGEVCRVDRFLHSLGVELIRLHSSPSDLLWPRFVWISTATSKRHLNVEGDESRDFVRKGNMLSVRFVLLAFVALVHSVFWVVPYQHTVKRNL